MISKCPHNHPACGKQVPEEHKEKDKFYVEYNDIRMFFCSLACLDIFRIERRKTKSKHATVCDLCSQIVLKGAEVASLNISGRTFDNCCLKCASSHTSEYVSEEAAQETPVKQVTSSNVKEKLNVGETEFGIWLKESVTRKASDLFISIESPPTLRVAGRFERIGEEGISVQQIDQVIEMILSNDQLNKFKSGKEVDLSLELPGVSRFRVNVFNEKGGASLAIRPLSYKIPNLQDLYLPPVIEELTHLKNGLILVVGTTGSGKSTTLAAFINIINQRDDKNIITIEDPVEFTYPKCQSIIHQREIGQHTESFSDGLRAALRENPDIIIVGELRDLESISLALRAAETGHLVLGTLHCGRAVQAITRITDVFDSSRQDQIRIQLAQSLQAIIAQQLICRKDGSGMVAATEVLIANIAIRNLIRRGREKEMQGYIQTGKRDHMHGLEQSVQSLIEEGVIGEEEAQKLGGIA